MRVLDLEMLSGDNMMQTLVSKTESVPMKTWSLETKPSHLKQLLIFYLWDGLNFFFLKVHLKFFLLSCVCIYITGCHYQCSGETFCVGQINLGKGWWESIKLDRESYLGLRQQNWVKWKQGLFHEVIQADTRTSHLCDGKLGFWI